jgi:hypothetical protein
MSDVASAPRRLRRKERKRMAAESLPVAGRRAYRAAHEVLEQGLDLWKMADHKGRVALMLLGPLNIVLLGVLYYSDILQEIPRAERVAIMIGLVVYAVLATAMFLLAIFALRPEEGEPTIGRLLERRADAPLGIRHYEDILTWDLDAYQRAWQRVTRAQLVAEMAEQAHAVATANRRKFSTLDYLYRGLQGMALLAVALLLAIGAALVLLGETGYPGHMPGIQGS